MRHPSEWRINDPPWLMIADSAVYVIGMVLCGCICGSVIWALVEAVQL